MNKLSLESFYGGKQGVSPVIKARFTSIDNMNENFSNPDYHDVWYGELCIIDTVNKRDKDNGKIFRRTLKKSEVEANTEDNLNQPNAEYLGRIVGPSEGFPNVKLGSIQWLKNTLGGENFNTNNQYIGPNGTGGIKKIKTKDEINEIDIITATENSQLIPGTKNTEGINYTWINVRNDSDDNDIDTSIYLGFDIPYPVFNLNFENVQWYDDDISYSVNENNSNLFYKEINIPVQKGIDGNLIGNIREAVKTDFRNWNNGVSEILYNFNNITIEKDDNGNTHFNLDNAVYNGDDLDNISKFYVYTVYINEKSNEGKYVHKPITCYLGAIRNIESINNEGVITYTDGTEESFNLPVIESIFVDKINDGNLKIKWKNGNNTPIGIYENGSLKGYVTANYITGLKIDEKTQEIRYITKLSQMDNSSKPFNSGSFYLNILKDVFLSKKDGHLYIKFSSSEYRYKNNPNDILTWIDINKCRVEDSKGQFWVCGGDLPKEESEPETITIENIYDSNIVWWLDLGEIIQKQRGLRIGAAFNEERYQTVYPNQQIPTNSSDFINILNKEWKKGNDDINYNPYYNGHIYIYDNVNNKNGTTYMLDNMGQIVISPDNKAYYWNSTKNTWALIGDWSDNTSSMQIKIKEGENILPSDLSLFSQNFILKTEEKNILESNWLNDFWN